jgi:hypothetical protein
MSSSHHTRTSSWLTDHVAPLKTPANLVCELWSLSVCPIPFLEKELFADQVHNANVKSPTGKLAVLSRMYGMFVVSSACTCCTWAGRGQL